MRNPLSVRKYRGQSVLARFLTKVTERADGCWIWDGCLNSWGYGRFNVGEEYVAAHRFAYTQFKGPIPDGLTIDHLCRNRNCVNPNHLEAVTVKVNVLRGNTIQALNASKTHCKRGHEFTPENTYNQPGGGRMCKACHRMHSLKSIRSKRSR